MKVGADGVSGRDSASARESGGVRVGSSANGVRLLVCFSGKIGSGKTSVSRAVARWLGCDHASFGGFLRDEMARCAGTASNRESLQDLGQSRIEKDAESFCRDVLSAGGFARGQDFVLDGVRHVAVLPHLARMAAPSEVRLIFLQADAELRSIRVRGRSDGGPEDFDRATGHPVEADMEDGLPLAAHAIVDSSLPEQDVVDLCIGLIDKWRSPRPSTPAPPAMGGDRCEAGPK